MKTQLSSMLSSCIYSLQVKNLKQLNQFQFQLQFLILFSTIVVFHLTYSLSEMRHCKPGVWSPPVVCLQKVEAWSAWQLGSWAWNRRKLCGAHPRRVVERFLLWRSHKLHLWEGNGDLYVWFCLASFPNASIFFVLLCVYSVSSTEVS